jgi:hypothetical protein
MNFITKSLFKLDRQFFGLHLKVEFIIYFLPLHFGRFLVKIGRYFHFQFWQHWSEAESKGSGPCKGRGPGKQFR